MLFVRTWSAVHRNYSEFTALEQHQIAELGLAKLGCILEHGLEYRLQLAGRTADDLEHFRSRRLLLQRLAKIVGALAQLVQQPRILDGDDGLRGEVLDQLDLLVGKRADLLAIDDDVPINSSSLSIGTTTVDRAPPSLAA